MPELRIKVTQEMKYRLKRIAEARKFKTLYDYLHWLFMDALTCQFHPLHPDGNEP